MSEKYEYKVFTDGLIRQYLLNQIFDNEVMLYQLTINPVDERLPKYEDWKYQVDTTLKNLNEFKKLYEELNGSYDLEEIRNVTDNS